jgi:hypothetical protein
MTQINMYDLKATENWNKAMIKRKGLIKQLRILGVKLNRPNELSIKTLEELVTKNQRPNKFDHLDSIRYGVQVKRCKTGK